jgi:hypothetical protein
MARKLTACHPLVRGLTETIMIAKRTQAVGRESASVESEFWTKQQCLHSEASHVLASSAQVAPAVRVPRSSAQRPKRPEAPGAPTKARELPVSGRKGDAESGECWSRQAAVEMPVQTGPTQFRASIAKPHSEHFPSDRLKLWQIKNGATLFQGGCIEFQEAGQTAARSASSRVEVDGNRS